MTNKRPLYPVIFLDTVLNFANVWYFHHVHDAIFELSQNNWSCDCNRGKVFDIYYHDSDHCVGSNRFIVVDACQDIKAAGIHELNSGYDTDLINESLRIHEAQEAAQGGDSE